MATSWLKKQSTNDALRYSMPARRQRGPHVRKEVNTANARARSQHISLSNCTIGV